VCARFAAAPVACVKSAGAHRVETRQSPRATVQSSYRCGH
jgi:hypothetical protein